MPKDVFLSHASDDQAMAATVSALLEERGIACWMAPRDVAAGVVWDEAILDAIEKARAFLLLLSSHSNDSPFVKNELNRAFSRRKPIVTFRIEDVIPGRSLELYLARHHWMDGFPPPIEEKVDRLAASIATLLGKTAAIGAAAGLAAVGIAEPGRALAAKRAPRFPWIARARATILHMPRRERLAWSIAVPSALLAAVLVVPATSNLRRAAPERLVTRLDLVTAENSREFALSPDGRQLVYVAIVESIPRLLLRALDQTTAQPLAGTDGASRPFWAPDSRAIGFFANGKLKRLDLAAAGGTSQVLADAPNSGGGAWNGHGVIVFAPTRPSTVLLRVPATGGTPTPVSRLVPGQGSQEWPQFLPDGQRFLFLVSELSGGHGIYVGSLDGGEPVRVVASEAQPLYAPPNQLLFLRQGVLVAQSFDWARASVSGEPLPVAPGVGMRAAGSYFMLSSVSASGVLAYRSGTAAQSRQLVWMDRSGRPIGTLGPADDAGLIRPVLSPDGSRVAVTRSPGNTDVWLMDIPRGVPSRFTFNSGVDRGAVWSPDGHRVIFGSNRTAGINDLFEKPANGAGDEQLLLKSGEIKMPLDMTPDGRFLLYTSINEKTAADLWALPLEGDRKPFPVVQTNFDDADGHFSPDGKWIAYESNESGRFEIYVRPFPGLGGKGQVSPGGGSQPLWGRDGKELFYIRPDLQLMAAPISLGADRQTVEAGAPVALFKPRLASGGAVTLAGGLTTPQYAVAPDGRFLVNIAVEEATTTSGPITIVLNWDAGLKK